MRSPRHILLIAIVLFVTSFVAYKVGRVRSASAERPRVSHPTQFVHTPQRGGKVWLQEQRRLQLKRLPAATAGQPLSMTDADVDEDGIQDLVIGNTERGGNSLAIYRGNLDAFAPQSQASFEAIGRGEFPSPFLPEFTTYDLPIEPDFVVAGRFNADDHADIAVASRKADSLYVLFGDGKGKFSDPQEVKLPGHVTGMATEHPNDNSSGDLALGISGSSFSMLIYRASDQGPVETGSFTLPGAASNLDFCNFGDPNNDLAFLSNGEVMVLRLSSMKLETISLPVHAVAMATGSFMFDRAGSTQIALLGDDGSVQIAAPSEFDPRPYTEEEFGAIRSAKVAHQPLPPFVPKMGFPSHGWQIVENMPNAVSTTAGTAPVFVSTRVSSNGADDIMMIDRAAHEMRVLSHATAPPGAGTFMPAEVAATPYDGSPIATLSMRINIDGRPGFIALHKGESAPSMMMPIPDPTFTVNTTSDILNTAATFCANGTPNKCSLRQAVWEANHTAGTDTISVPAGTYTLTIAKVANDYSGQFGALYINDSVNIVGSVDGSGNPTSIIQAGTTAYNAGTPNGVDMVMAVNEDINPLTNATASISNVIIQNGHNRGTHGNDGDGGCMEFDTGTSGNANLTLTNTVLQNCDTTQGGGAGLVTFNFLNHNNNGFVTITNSTIQNNSAVDNPSSGAGGGIALSNDSHMVMTNSKVLNNKATQVISGQKGQGGGIINFFPNGNYTGVTKTTIHSSTISGNKAAGFGGGIQSQTDLLVDQGTIISNNVAGTDGTNPVAAQDGGGLYLNTFASGCPACTFQTTLTHVTITGNSASGNGGGISTGNAGAFPSAGSLIMTFSRLAGNSATGVGSNLKNSGTTVSATNDWWGTDLAATTINTSGGGGTTFDPFIVLTHSATPAKIRINQSTTLTGDMSKDNHGTAVGLANLDQIIGLPITFNNAVLGTIPQAQPEVLNASAQATATFNAGGTSGRGTANATVDQGVIGANSNPIASATEAGTTVTITTVGAHNFAANETVVISGVGVAGYNGTFTILATPTATTFTYTAGAGLAASSGGTANVGIIILEPPQIAKNFGAATIPINGTTTVSFSVTNPNVVAVNASFTDTLPAGLQVGSTPGVTNTCGGSVTAVAGSGSISFTNNLTPIGTCTITVNVTGTVDNAYTNSVSILSTDAGNGNTSSANITVINPPHIVKVFGAAGIPLNGTTSLTFTIDSNGNQNLTQTGVAFTDSLPAGLINATPSNVSTTCSGGTATAANGGSTVSLAGASVPPVSSCTVSVTVKGSTAGTKSNSVQVTSTNAGTGNTSTANLDVIAPPTITKDFTRTATIAAGPTGATESGSTVTITTTTPHGFIPGQTVVIAGVGVAGYNGTFAILLTPTPTTFTYTNATTGLGTSGGGTATVGNSIPLNTTDTLKFTITNPNTIAGGDLTGIAFSDTLPSATGTLVVSNTPNVTNTCNGTVTAAAGSSVISLSGGSVLHNASCTITVDVKGTAAGDAANTTGAITSTEGGTGVASNTAMIKVVAPPTISKAFGAGSIPLNGTTTVTFTLQNPAANTSALHGIAFSDTLTNGLQVASTPGVSNTCGGTVTAVANSTSISLSNGAIVTPGNTCTITVNVTGTQAGNVPNTTSTISSIEGLTGATSNTPSLLVVAPPTIAKAFGASSIPLNGTTSLTLTISNPNTVILNGLAFTDNLPAGLVVSTPNGLSNTCGGAPTATAGSGVVSLSGGSVGSSTSCTVAVNVTGTTAGTKLNTTGAVSSTEGGTGVASNTATLQVVGPPTVSKSFGPTSIPLNGTSTLTFTVTNANTNSALNGVAFSDTLTSGLVVATPPNVTGSCGAGTITANAGSSSISLSGGTLTASPAAGSTCTFAVNVIATTAGSKDNTTGAITSTEGGTGATSNTATLQVVAPPTISKAFGAANVPLNGTTTLTFTITSPAANGTAENGIAFSDTLTNGLQVASTPGVSNTCNGTVTATANSTSISLSGGSIATPGNTCTIVVNVTATQSGTVSNTTGAISSTNGGTGATSNTATLDVCAASITVTTTADSGAGSLRQALLDICDGGTVSFDTAGVFSTPQTITLTTGELSLTKNVTINGPSAAGNHVTVSGNNASRVFTVQPGKTVTINNLTVSGGNGGGTMSGLGGGVLNVGGTLALNNSVISNNSIVGSGGGIFNNAGVMTITNSTISGNTTTSGSGGGGIFNQTGATVTVSNSTLSGNNTTGNGGAIYNNAGTVNLTDSTLSTNSANNTGGGILNQSGSTLNVANSTISANAALTGGGLYNDSAPAIMVNSTVSGNTATGSGGGIAATTTGVTLTNVTVTNNHSDNDNSGAESGGGIFIGSGTISLLNTIVAGNFIGSAATVADDINGAGTAGGSFNLIGTGGSGGLTNGVNNNQVGVADAKLGALANNGGATQTHALLATSPAIDAGTNVTTLNGGIDNVTTTVVVTDGTSIPAGVGFVIQIDNEQMIVTAKTTNTLTVTRGANATPPASHSDGAAVNPAFDQRDAGFPRKLGSSVDIGAFELGAADLSITKTDGSATAVPGTLVTYTIVVTNNGPSAANGASVSDTLPATLTGVTFTSVVSGGATGNTAAGSGNISDTVNMPSGSTITYTVNATIRSSATGTLSNTATVTAPGTISDPNSANNSATDTDTLTPTADLSITKTDGSAIGVPGTPVTYTIVVTNNGPSDANGVTVSDPFPATLTGVTFTSVASGGATGNTAGSGNISDTLNMPAGSSVTYTVNATIKSSATGSLSNTATVTAPAGVTDPTPGNNSATDTDTLSPQADLSITKTDGVTNVVPGSPVTYTITVTNNGPSNANGATVADTFTGTLTGVTYTSVTTGGATGNTAAGSGNINDTVNLPAGSTITYTANATVSASATGTLSNTATVTAPGGVTDPVPGNNSATDTDTLTASADVSVTKADSPDPVQQGNNITYTITVTNNGPSDSQSLSLSDAVPANTTLVAVVTAAGWTRTDAVPGGGTGTLTFTRATQNAAAASIFTVVVNVTAGTANGTTISNTAIVSSATTDPVPGNNSATATTLVENRPNINVHDAKAAEPASGTTNMLFTVALSFPAPAGASVDYATADLAPGPGHAVAGICGAGGDYVATSGTLNFATGQQFATIPVTICADGLSEPDETFQLNLSNPVNLLITNGQAIGTITNANTAGTFIISELRTSGPAGPGDDFVELYNNTDSPLTVAASDASAGYGLFKMGTDCNATPVLIAAIPNGTVIPARGHYLLVGSQYSLANYGGAGAAAGDQALTSDIESDRNVAVFSTSDVANISSANRLDAVGFGSNINGGGAPNGVCDLLREGNNLPAASGSTLEYSFFRNECDFNGSVCTSANGFPKDTNDNSADFLFADTQATATPMGQRLGAPGPQNRTSGIQRNSTLAIPLLDSTVGQPAVPNRVFTAGNFGLNATHGELSIRRRVQNNTGGDVTALRFRIIEITTLPLTPSFVDLRALTSSDISVSNIHDTTTCIDRTSGTASNCTVTVKGTTLEEPPTQSLGGGYNSSMRVDLSGLPGGHLAANQSVEFQLLFGTTQGGRFHVYINVEDDVVGGGDNSPGHTLGSFVEDVVVEANQTISFNTPANATYGDGDFSVTATSSAGLPVTFAGSGQCAVSSAGLVHLTGAGACAVTASQVGDSNTNPAADVVQTFTIGRAATATAVSSSGNSVKLADPVTFTAKVSQAANLEIPSGTVQFKDNGANLGGPTSLNGSAVAILTTSALTAGNHTITAEYSGNTNLNASSAALPATQVVSNRPLVNFNAANYTVKQSDGLATVVVNRSGDLSVPVTVDYATSDSGVANCANVGIVASARCNFSAMYGTFKFAAGETQKTLDIPLTQNAYGHGPQTLTVNLSNVTGTDATLVTPSAANVTITDSLSSTPNSIDDTTDFVRQQYHDFLNREPDAAGLAFWKDNIDSCNAPGGAEGYASAAQCVEVKRVITSAAFFLSIEFRGTGGLVRDFYVAALDRPATNNMPDIVEFTRDTQAVQAGVVVNQGDWQKTLAANRTAFMSDFVMRPEFVGLYPASDSPAQYVDKLYQHANVTGATAQDRLDAIGEFGNAAAAADPDARGRALLRITQNASFQARELNRGFVQMQYFGYLRRNPTDAPDNNASGYNFWVTKLNQFNGDFLAAEMVKAFLSSREYRQRFGTP